MGMYVLLSLLWGVVRHDKIWYANHPGAEERFDAVDEELAHQEPWRFRNQRPR